MLITTYTSQWKADFERLKEVLQKPFTGMPVWIEHIGSTAVQGLAAKPIIDIDIVYSITFPFEEINRRLADLGYYHNGDQGIKEREAFRLKKGFASQAVLNNITHHLYVCREDSAELKRHLLFRDYLRRHPESRLQYQQLKQEIAEQAGQDQKSYAVIKELAARSFIDDIIRRSALESGDY